KNTCRWYGDPFPYRMMTMARSVRTVRHMHDHFECTTQIRNRPITVIIIPAAPRQPGEAPAVTPVPAACAGPLPVLEPGHAHTAERRPLTKAWPERGTPNPGTHGVETAAPLAQNHTPPTPATASDAAEQSETPSFRPPGIRTSRSSAGVE